MVEINTPWAFEVAIYFGGSHDVILNDIPRALKKINHFTAPGTVIPVDFDLKNRQIFKTNKLYVLTKGQLNIEYKDNTSDLVTSSYYDSDSWVSYKTFWQTNKMCHIQPSSECLFHEFSPWNGKDEDPSNHFDLFDILIKKIEPGTHVINYDQTKQTCLTVLKGDKFRNGGRIQISSGEHSFDSENPTVSQLFTDGVIPLPPADRAINYLNQDSYQFMLKGDTTITNDKTMHLLLMVAKSPLVTTLVPSSQVTL
jgi:hypothetical protein